LSTNRLHSAIHVGMRENIDRRQIKNTDITH